MKGLLRRSCRRMAFCAHKLFRQLVSVFDGAARYSRLGRVSGSLCSGQAPSEIGRYIRHRHPDAGLRIVGEASEQENQLRLHGLQHPIPSKKLFEQQFDFRPVFLGHLASSGDRDHRDRAVSVSDMYQAYQNFCTSQGAGRG